LSHSQTTTPPPSSPLESHLQHHTRNLYQHNSAPCWCGKLKHHDEREGNIHGQSHHLKLMINEYCFWFGINFSQPHFSVPNQQQHTALQNTYRTNGLHIEPDATAFSEHRTLHQRHVIASPFFVGIGGFGVVVGESDWLAANEQMITFCAEKKNGTRCFVWQSSSVQFTECVESVSVSIKLFQSAPVSMKLLESILRADCFLFFIFPPDHSLLSPVSSTDRSMPSWLWARRFSLRTFSALFQVQSLFVLETHFTSSRCRMNFSKRSAHFLVSQSLFSSRWFHFADLRSFAAIMTGPIPVNLRMF